MCPTETLSVSLRFLIHAKPLQLSTTSTVCSPVKTTTALRQLLQRPGIVRSLGAHDVFSAMVMEQAGIDMLFAGGFGVAASALGMPDVGLMTLTEMAEVVRRMADRLSIPVVADGDTGHGDLHNVARTVRDMESAGAAGILLEDQVHPKRCGHLAGKEVIPAAEMRMKLRAALDARRDSEFVIFARTDALAVEGVDSAIERAGGFAEEGADVCFVEGPTSLEQLGKIPRKLNVPLLANMLTGGVTPVVPFAELEQMGYKIAVCPIAGLLATGAVIRRMTETLLQNGKVDPTTDVLMTFEEVKSVLRLQETLDLRRRLES